MTTKYSLQNSEFLPGFSPSPHFNEQVKKLRFQPGIKVLINAPAKEIFNTKKQVSLILYALPRDNTIDQTAGKKITEGIDPAFGLQHIAAQTRKLREVIPDKNIVTVYLEAEELSWTIWKEKYKNNNEIIRKVVENICEEFNLFEFRLTLASHSAGGNFMLGYLENVDFLPDYFERLSFIDSNYSYSNEKHGKKIIDWLKNEKHFLSIIAYDDRRVRVDGKAIIEPGQGTYRKTYELIRFLEQEIKLNKTDNGIFTRFKGLNGQVDLIIHNNIENEMLHSKLVGEKNGFIHSITCGTKYEDQAGEYNGPVIYDNWIQEY
jgi:hypothetical protein